MNKSNSCSYDVFVKKGITISSDSIPEALLHQIILVRCPDGTIEKRIEALEFAINYLSESEMVLLFFRYFQGQSHKTLKRTLMVGSTRTVATRLGKLISAIKEYMFYYMNSDYASDLEFISDSLGIKSMKVADKLFRRYSKNKIYRDPSFQISRRKLNKVIDNIEMLCLRELRLGGFWRVLKAIGRLK